MDCGLHRAPVLQVNRGAGMPTEQHSARPAHQRPSPLPTADLIFPNKSQGGPKSEALRCVAPRPQPALRLARVPGKGEGLPTTAWAGAQAMPDLRGPVKSGGSPVPPGLGKGRLRAPRLGSITSVTWSPGPEGQPSPPPRPPLTARPRRVSVSLWAEAEWGTEGV